jgi:hypothetical protein
VSKRNKKKQGENGPADAQHDSMIVNRACLRYPGGGATQGSRESRKLSWRRQNTIKGDGTQPLSFL